MEPFIKVLIFDIKDNAEKIQSKLNESTEYRGIDSIHVVTQSYADGSARLIYTIIFDSQ